MYKTTTRHHKRTHHNDYDIYGDLAKIKDALADATYGIKNHAGDVLSERIGNVGNFIKDKQEDVSTYVSGKPFKSIGVALLAGVCLGYIIHK